MAYRYANRRHAAGGSGKKAEKTLLVEVLLLEFLPVGIGHELLVAFVDDLEQFGIALSHGHAECRGCRSS